MLGLRELKTADWVVIINLIYFDVGVYVVGTFSSHSLWAKVGWEQAREGGPSNCRRSSWNSQVPWILLKNSEDEP